MASVWPAKNNYATGDVLTAANMNGVGDDLNDVYSYSFTNNFFAGKNKIINGDFGIWQRGTTATVTGGASPTYLPDRFFSYLNGSGSGTQSQQSFTVGTAPVSGYESQYFYRLAIGTLGTTNTAQIGQRIEDVRTFAGQTINFSFWAKADSARSFGFFVTQIFGSGGSADVTTNGSTFSVTTSWTRFSGSVTLPSISGKTLGSSNYLQIFVQPTVTAGFSLDTWGWQLEAGSTATPFQTATGTKQGELAACQRYYIRWSNTSSGYLGGTGIGVSTTVGKIVYQLPVEMRIAPTSLDYSNVALFDGTNILSGSTPTLATGAGTKTVAVDNTVASSVVQYRPYFNIANGTGYIGLSAEL